MVAIVPLLTVAVVISGSQQLDEVQRLTSGPLDTAAAGRVLSIYEEGDGDAKAYIAAHAPEIWDPFLAYAFQLPGSDGWIQKVRVRIGGATAALADRGNDDAVRALCAWASAEGQMYPGSGHCGVGLELQNTSRKRLEGVDTTRLLSYLQSEKLKVFYGSACALEKRVPSAVREACFIQLGSEDELTRRCALQLLTRLDCTEEQMDRLAGPLDDSNRMTRLLIAEEMPGTWLDHWNDKPVSSRPITVRLAMAKKGLISVDELLTDPAPEVAAAGLLSQGGTPEHFISASHRVLSSGPFPE